MSVEPPSMQPGPPTSRNGMHRRVVSSPSLNRPQSLPDRADCLTNTKAHVCRIIPSRFRLSTRPDDQFRAPLLGQIAQEMKI